MKIQNKILLISLLTISNYSYGSFSFGHTFTDNIGVLVVIGGIVTLITGIGYFSNKNKGKFFTENNVFNGWLTLFLSLLVISSLVEIFNGKIGVSCLILSIYGVVYFVGKENNKK